jgi:hypothetical protein
VIRSWLIFAATRLNNLRESTANELLSNEAGNDGISTEQENNQEDDDAEKDHEENRREVPSDVFE